MIKAVGVVEEPLSLALRRVLSRLLTTVKHKSPANPIQVDHQEEEQQGDGPHDGSILSLFDSKIILHFLCEKYFVNTYTYIHIYIDM